MNKKGNPEQIRYVMKITVLQMILTLVLAGNLLAKETSSQELLDKKISISVTNQFFKNILTGIEKETGVKFAYTSGIISLKERTSVNASNERLGDVLTGYLLHLILRMK